MARSRPKWFDAALEALATGTPIAAVARQCGVRRETISRALRAPDSELKAELDRRRSAATAAVTGSGLAEKALAVVDRLATSGDDKLALDAAKTALVHHARTTAAAPPEPPPEEEVSAEQSIKELVAALPTVKIVLAEGRVSPVVVDELRHALRQALSDLDPLPQAASVPSPPMPPPPLPN